MQTRWIFANISLDGSTRFVSLDTQALQFKGSFPSGVDRAESLAFFKALGFRAIGQSEGIAKTIRWYDRWVVLFVSKLVDRFRVEVISQTPNPQQTIYAALHQDYSENFVFDERHKFPTETECGSIVVKRLLLGGRGHYGPLEHPQIVFNCGYFPHSVMQQARTHRTGVSFDVQCLAGNTAVTVVNSDGQGCQTIEIAQLYDLWTHGERSIRDRTIEGHHGEAPGLYRRDCQKRLNKMRLRVLNEETGYFQIGHLQDVMCSGTQPVYRLTLEDGKTLDCTINHRLLTREGWQHMGDALGLIVNPNHEVLARTKSCQLLCNGRVRNLTEESRDLNHLEAQLAEDFEELSHPKNRKPQRPVVNRQLSAHPVAVVNAEYLGLQMTYDLEVAGDWHNFVANGIVVHNSLRYTGMRFLDLVAGKRDVEEVFYLRPVGDYEDRQGKKYHYCAQQRQADLEWCLEAAKRYSLDIEAGMSEEHARGKLPFDYRQHFIVSFNLRSLMHFLDLRSKKNAQLEIQKLCDLMWIHFEAWVPEIADWYAKNRLGKAKLSP